MTPTYRLTAVEALRYIQAGVLTTEALAKTCVDRILELEPSLNAWAWLRTEQALSEATEIDTARRLGKPLGPLAGIPIGIKDIFNTADMPTQMGSPIWAGYTPGNDARVVASLRKAGGILMGKTVTAEFAVHVQSGTIGFPATRNPHHPEHSPGTSSSGSAAAVAAGMVPVSIGSQTAGSIIRPASYCGVYGFKPSFGLIPRTGILKTTDTLDTVGFFARGVEDLRLLLELTRVQGENYPPARTVDDPSRRKPEHRPWRVAVVKGPKWSDAEPYAQQALLRFASELAAKEGVAIEETEPPPGIVQSHRIHETIYNKALSYYFKQEFQKKPLLSPTLQQMIIEGQKTSVEEYRRALLQQAELSLQMDRWFEQGPDILLTLSTGGEAPKIDVNDRPDNCLIWTLCGLPSINLPVFTGPAGLPFGAQLVARRYNDLALLDFAETISRREAGVKELV